MPSVSERFNIVSGHFKYRVRSKSTDRNDPDPNDHDQNDRDRNVPDPNDHDQNDRDRNVPDPNDRDQNDLDPFNIKNRGLLQISVAGHGSFSLPTFLYFGNVYFVKLWHFIHFLSQNVTIVATMEHLYCG